MKNTAYNAVILKMRAWAEVYHHYLQSGEKDYSLKKLTVM